MPMSFVESIRSANYEEVQQHISKDHSLLLQEIDGDIPAVYAIKHLKAGLFESERKVKNVQRYLFNETMLYNKKIELEEALTNKNILQGQNRVSALLKAFGEQEEIENKDVLFKALQSDNYEKVRKFLFLNPRIILTQFSGYASIASYPIHVVRNLLNPETKTYQYIMNATAIYFFSPTFEANLTKGIKADVAFAAGVGGVAELKSTAAACFSKGVLVQNNNELQDFEDIWEEKLIQYQRAIQEYNEREKNSYESNLLMAVIKAKELEEAKRLIEQNPYLLAAEVDGQLPYELAYMVCIFNRNPDQIRRINNDMFRYVLNETLILQNRLRANLYPNARDLKAIMTLGAAFSTRTHVIESLNFTFLEFVKGLKDYNHEKVRLYVLHDFTWLIKEENNNEFTFALDLLIEGLGYRNRTKEFLIEQTALGLIRSLREPDSDSKFFTLDKFKYLRNFLPVFEKAKEIFYAEDPDKNFENLFLEAMNRVNVFKYSLTEIVTHLHLVSESIDAIVLDATVTRLSKLNLQEVLNAVSRFDKNSHGPEIRYFLMNFINDRLVSITDQKQCVWLISELSGVLTRLMMRTTPDSKMIGYYLQIVRKKTDGCTLDEVANVTNDNEEGESKTISLSHSTLFSKTWMVSTNREKEECNTNPYLDERLDNDSLATNFKI